MFTRPPKLWRNQKDKKNAIPNSLFIQAAAKLHQRTPGDAGNGSYLDWAQRTWTWFKASGLLNSDQQVFDTLNNLTDCHAEGAIFTYNNGTLVGALVDLAAITDDQALLDQAGAIARATMTLMSDNGTLKEAGCGGDVCTQFKGVFLRNLLDLYRARPAADLQAYMRHQSDQLWNVSKNAQDQFGYGRSLTMAPARPANAKALRSTRSPPRSRRRARCLERPPPFRRRVRASSSRVALRLRPQPMQRDCTRHAGGTPGSRQSAPTTRLIAASRRYLVRPSA